MAVFASRQIVMPDLSIAVTITGTGNETYCYATINGTKYSAAASNISVMHGDTITFGIVSNGGSITIDGTQVIGTTSGSIKTYDWTVPSGISTIEIAMEYIFTSRRITITTA